MNGKEKKNGRTFVEWEVTTVKVAETNFTAMEAKVGFGPLRVIRCSRVRYKHENVSTQKWLKV